MINRYNLRTKIFDKDIVVYKKYSIPFERYIYLVEYISGESLNEMLNRYNRYLTIGNIIVEKNESYFVINMINEYKKVLREEKINMLIDG